VAGDRLVQGNVFGFQSVAVSFQNRDTRLLGEVARSCHSIIAQAGRAVELTPDARDEIVREINRVLDDADGGIRVSAGNLDADDQLFYTAHYFASLAAQLTATGLTDGANGAAEVVRRLEDEARRLRRLAGGSYGTSGDAER